MQIDLYNPFRSRQTPQRTQEHDGLIASAAVCPIPDCGAMVIAYRALDSVSSLTRGRNANWEFTCSRCGFEFLVPEDELIFHGVPGEWLRAEICLA